MILTSRSPYRYIDSAHIIQSDGEDSRFGFKVEDAVFDDSIGKDYNFISNDIKVVIPVYGSLFHLLFDTIGATLNEHKNNNDLVFIFDTSTAANEKTGSLNDFLQDVLKTKKIKHNFVNLGKKKALINRFYFIEKAAYGLDRFVSVGEYADEQKLGIEKPPYRKVYLSRKRSTQDSNRWKRPDLAAGLPFVDDARIYNEELVEDYFKKHGYEIIYGEDVGDTFQEKIKYFSSIKTLVSPTGAGLSHSIFMGPDSKIIELAVPIGRVDDDGHWDFGIHVLYQKVCLIREIPYMSILSWRSAEKIISAIDSSPFIKGVLLND